VLYWLGRLDDYPEWMQGSELEGFSPRPSEYFARDGVSEPVVERAFEYWGNIDKRRATSLPRASLGD
jgi:hypothetical protein